MELFSLFSSLGTALSPIASGFLYGINNSYVIVLYALMILAVASLILYVLAVKTKPNYEAAQAIKTKPVLE